MLAENKLWDMAGMDSGWFQTSLEATAPSCGELRCDHPPVYDNL